MPACPRGLPGVFQRAPLLDENHSRVKSALNCCELMKVPQSSPLITTRT